MTIKEFKELTKNLDENTPVFVSLFGKKLRQPSLELVDGIKYDGEEDCWDKTATRTFEKDGKPLPCSVFPVVKISC